MTLITGGPVDLSRLNAYYGTDLRPGEFTVHEVRMPLGVIALMVARCSLLDGVAINTTRNATANAITCLVLGLGIPLFEEVRSGWLSHAAHQIAKYSYGIYLLHIPCLALVFRHLPLLPLPLKVGAFLAITGATSAFTYHLIEHPLIQLGRSIARRIELSQDSKSWHSPLPSDEPRIPLGGLRTSS